LEDFKRPHQVRKSPSRLNRRSGGLISKTEGLDANALEAALHLELLSGRSKLESGRPEGGKLLSSVKDHGCSTGPLSLLKITANGLKLLLLTTLVGKERLTPGGEAGQSEVWEVLHRKSQKTSIILRNLNPMMAGGSRSSPKR